jgi:hypothetical protein
MPYTISLSDDQRYILLTVTGEMTSELAMQQNIEAHNLGAKLGINRYLVDVTGARNIDSFSDTYRFAYVDMNTAVEIDKDAIVAMLVSLEDHSHDFIETISKHAGLNVTLFRDRDQALRHLLG